MKQMTILPEIPEALVTEMDSRWEGFIESLTSAQLAPPDDPLVVDGLRRALVFSDFITRTCRRYPDVPAALVSRGEIQRTYAQWEYAAKLASMLDSLDTEADLSLALRVFRREEMVRIAVRDLAGWADLNGTMEDLSHLADACLDGALTVLYRWACHRLGTPADSDGIPQALVILGMGKLGADELNFSSDVDLIFAYPESGSTAGGNGSVSNERFFTELARQLIKVIGSSTPEGFVFRVDTDLRPYGNMGPLVMNFDAMEDYFIRQGREWERYAWIKARAVGGDKAAGRRLLDRLKPFVFRRYLDYGIFESLRDMKQKISRDVKARGVENSIKLGRGGIRQIEFFGQVFQLIRGGVTPELQNRRILNVLRTLAAHRIVPQAVHRRLSSAYIFLRNTENRLQYVNDQQTHTLPEGGHEKIRLAAAMGFPTWDLFLQALNGHMADVARHFDALLEKEPVDMSQDEAAIEKRLHGVWVESVRDDKAGAVLLEAGFENPDHVLHLLESLRNDIATRALNQEGHRRLDRLVPLVLKASGTSKQSDTVLTRIVDLLRAIERRISYFSLLLENPDALTHLVKLAAASPFIIIYLSRHPVLLDELLDPRTLYAPPERDELETEMRNSLNKIDASNLEYLIEALCIFKQVNTLRVAAADITGVLPLMKVSDRLSWIAEILLTQVLNLAWNELVRKHGRPACRLDGNPLDRGFAVIGYGKLGGIEMGYASDLDLVFIHAGTAGETSGGRAALDNTQFYVRLGQRIIHLLTTRTTAGVLYDTDMRLRPSGGSGVIVSHIEAYESYQLEKAWTWEHQALVRARPICGDQELARRFMEIRRQVLRRHRTKGVLKQDVRDMRRRMYKETKSPVPGKFNVKHDPGGIIDIEFLVQYLVLLLSENHHRLTDWTDTVRMIGTLADIGALCAPQARSLKQAYLAFRAVVHENNLQEMPPFVCDREYRELRGRITGLWAHFLEE